MKLFKKNFIRVLFIVFEGVSTIDNLFVNLGYVYSSESTLLPSISITKLFEVENVFASIVGDFMLKKVNFFFQ